jgi:transcriptional regulatory protein GAL4
LEDRCRKLESILRILNPNVDVDSLVSIKPEEPPQSAPETPLEEEGGPISDQRGFEWHEGPIDNVNSLTDGMAMLNFTTPDQGYIGLSSGSSLLKVVHTLLRQHGMSPPESDDKQDSFFVPRSEPPKLHNAFYSTTIANFLVDAYFRNYNVYYAVVHERTFRQAYENMANIPDDSNWHFLFHTVLAVGAYASNVEAEHNDAPLYQAARARMSTRLLESGTLENVQAFCLMGNYLQKRDRPNTAYNLIGIAIRMALGLGLHRDTSDKSIRHNTLAQEQRRRVWWILYMIDSGFSITMGRPVSTSESMISTRLPINVDDSHFTMDMLLPPPIDAPTTYSATIEHAKLGIIANQVHNIFLSTSTQYDLATKRENIGQMEEKLAKWRENLPAYFTDPDPPEWFLGPRTVLIWKEQNIRMMMYKEVLTATIFGDVSKDYQKTLSAENAAKSCLRVAVDTISAIGSFCLAHVAIPHGISWYATYFLFHAILFLEIAILKSPTDPLISIWTEKRDQGRQTLTHIGRGNTAALRCLAVLDQILMAKSASDSQGRSPNFTMSSSQTLFPPQVLPVSNDPQKMNVEYNYLADPSLQSFWNPSQNPSLFNGVEETFPGAGAQEDQRFDYLPRNNINIGIGGGFGAAEFGAPIVDNTAASIPVDSGGAMNWDMAGAGYNDWVQLGNTPEQHGTHTPEHH